MAAKNVKFSQDGRENMLRGVDIFANAVKVTLGPKAATSLFEKSTAPRITNDAVTVAKGIELQDMFENMARAIVKERDDGGDGEVDAVRRGACLAEEQCELLASWLLHPAVSTVPMASGNASLPAGQQPGSCRDLTLRKWLRTGLGISKLSISGARSGRVRLGYGRRMIRFDRPRALCSAGE